MSKLRRRYRVSLETLAALGAALLTASAASALTGPRSIASDTCDYASNKPVQMQTEINARMLLAGFIGLPPDQCDKFVKSLVKSCLQAVKAGTRCTLDVNAAAGLNAGKMSDVGCDAEPTPDEQKSCKSTVKKNTSDNAAIASQTVQQIGSNTCNGGFALFMSELCLEGATPP